MAIETLLNWVNLYGALALGLLMLPGAVGVPVPGSALLVAAGALSRQGSVDGLWLVVCAWVGAVLSDAGSFVLGRAAGGWAQRRFGKLNLAVWTKAQGYFARRGGLAVFVTRFLLMSLAIPTNLIAGGTRYPFWRFVGWSAAGKLIWIIFHCGLGYAFASQWQLVSEAAGQYGSWLGAAAAVAAVLFLLVRKLARRRELSASPHLPGDERSRAMPQP